ncbi:hypothetical protein pb186bvf_020466 [Paramecium bursaria]
MSKDILEYYEKLKQTHLKDLLEDDERNSHLVAEYDGILLDYTHEKVDLNLLHLFQKLAEENHLPEKIQSIQQGAIFNSTEGRAVLHTALRSPPDSVVNLNGLNVTTDVHAVLKRIQQFTDGVRSGNHQGYTKKQLKNTVVIGIGGSYLGIEFIYEALRTHYNGKINSHGRKLRFLANVDPVDSARALEDLDVEETLFVINSKTFTTAETILNAKLARKWILDQYSLRNINDEKGVLSAHLTAVSTNLPETSKFGISDDKVFGFWDWVGGRYSVTSAIGVLPLSLQFGFAYVLEVLAGAHSIDQHIVKENQVSKNLPLLLGILGWYRSSIQKYQAIALIPYAQSLLRFPAHIQQVHMESNGKQAVIDGGNYLQAACPFVFGEPGTNSQHSFFQLIHQGTNIIPCEFIGYAKSQLEEGAAEPQIYRSQHDELMSNYFAQVDALAIGKTAEEVIKEGVKQELVQHKVFPGDRPSLQILFKNECNPYNVGQLLALYEHRVLVEGLLWGINPFDQWGVELGKVLAKNVRQALNSQDLDNFNANSATKNLLKKYRTFQG